jgi:hypothetical protein
MEWQTMPLIPIVPAVAVEEEIADQDLRPIPVFIPKRNDNQGCCHMISKLLRTIFCCGCCQSTPQDSVPLLDDSSSD